MKHNCTKCSHHGKLLYCADCDTVYCEGCGKEWKKEISYSYGTTTTWPPNCTYTGGTTLNNCTHNAKTSL